MRTALLTVLVGAAVSVAIGAVTADGWPGYVVGAVLALALWVMLLFGSSARPGERWTVRWEDYLVAAVVGLLLGGAMFLASDDNAAFWAPGFIIGGVLLPSASAAVRRGERS